MNAIFTAVGLRIALRLQRHGFPSTACAHVLDEARFTRMGRELRKDSFIQVIHCLGPVPKKFQTAFYATFEAQKMNM